MTYNPTPINQLVEQTTLSLADQLPFYSQSAGTRRMAVSVLFDLILAQISPAADFEIDTASPSASPAAFTIDPTTDGGSVWLISTPTGTMAVATLALPDEDNAVDGQEVVFNTTQALTSLTVSATGLSVVGAPTTLAANGFFRMKYAAVNSTWYRIG